MYAFRLALKNVLARKSSLAIVLFIALSIALLVLSNALFDGTDNGIETTFVNSFTGKIVVCPDVEFPLSLFGDETPVTGSLSKIPTLIPYTDVLEMLKETKEISAVIPQLSGAAALNVNNTRIATMLFGVQADTYLENMTGIELLEGKPYTAERGLMLSTQSLALVEKETGVRLAVGDAVQLITASGSSFTIRSVPLTGIYKYKVENATLERIALVDPETVRSLMNIQDAQEEPLDVSEEEIALLQDDFDIDELFAEIEDAAGEEVSREHREQVAAVDKIQPQKQTAGESTVWSYLVCKTEDGVNAKALLHKLNAQFRKNGWEVEAQDWRSAAGGTVSLIFYLRVILNTGIILILATGFIEVVNTLSISALGRVSETGTLRALGAGRRFIAKEFFFETAILTITAGILGCVLGVLLNALFFSGGIPLHNEYLSQLFGGDRLVTSVTFSNLARCMLLSVLLAFVGFLNPVRVALQCNPAVAMRGQA